MPVINSIVGATRLHVNDGYQCCPQSIVLRATDLQGVTSAACIQLYGGGGGPVLLAIDCIVEGGDSDVPSLAESMFGLSVVEVV